MSSNPSESCALPASWWIRRNPLYLLSAVCMAAGARMFLVTPGARAGDVEIILLTMGVLQLYEWGVTGVLLALHRARRAPEDRPSLLLVAIMFWTGPLAATQEMAAHDLQLGLLTAAAACLMAWWELRIVSRVMQLGFSRWSVLTACVAVCLVALLPSCLRTPARANQLNELYLYAAWWGLAACALMSIPAVHSFGRRWV